MIKINLITRAEQDRLDKLRAVHQFYLDNYDREYMRRIRLARINNAFEICNAVVRTVTDMMKAFGAMNRSVAINTQEEGSITVTPIQQVINKVEQIKRQSEME